MKIKYFSNFIIFIFIFLGVIFSFIIFKSDSVSAGSYNGQDLALAILQNQSILISSSYSDNDPSGHREAIVLSSLGTMLPTDGDNFAFFSTGIAGSVPVTTDGAEPGNERGTWFRDKYGNPRDYSELTMKLKVPLYMHYFCYHVQFFSAEYPEYIGTQYNDKLTITVNSPSKGTSQYTFDVNSGYFVLKSNNIPGTGYDIFAQSGNPSDVDLVDRIPRTPGADAGASDLIPIGGTIHPVSPGEIITVKIKIIDVGDNQFDSGAFIDSVRFSGFAQTKIVAIKDVIDLNGGKVECNDTLEYTIIISNTGTVKQNNNPGNEFEDYIPVNTTYVPGSAYSQYGTIQYLSGENKIIWNGDIPSATSRVLKFRVKVNNNSPNSAIISNQGKVLWDKNEDGINEAIELTDDIYVNDGIDQDGDGETGDDDPNILIVYKFDYPSVVTEDFSDDSAGNIAVQYYLYRKWFETKKNNASGSCFEVAPNYHYLTTNSFKTKIRQSDGTQYWNYYISNLNASPIWWELWFACGDTSEDYDLYFILQNNNGQEIAKICLKYVNNGEKPMNWLLELFFWDPIKGWTRLNSDLNGGYLRNDWYKLRIERNGTSNIDYTLGRHNLNVIDFKTGGQLDAPLTNLKRVEWMSTTNPDPVVCPMFFWDEHSIGLTYQN